MVIDPFPKDLQPTIYTDPRTIYSQPSNLYDPPNRPQRGPRPAAPAVGIQPESPPPSGVSLPTSSSVWQRQHARQLATKVTGASTFTLSPPAARGSVPDVGNIVYQSLQRPKLLRGGEWQLSVLTNLIAAAFVILAIMQWNWRFLPGALFFGGPIQWLLRLFANRDPKLWLKYVRSVNQPVVREAHGRPEDSAPAPMILPKPNWFIH